MEFRTIDMDFEYNIKEIFQKLKDNFSEDIEKSGLSFSDWLWENKEELGKAFFEKVDSYCGVDEIIEEMNKE